MKIGKRLYERLICADRLVAIHLDLNCGAIYERIRYYCEITSQDWYAPKEPLYKEVLIQKRTFFRCIQRLQNFNLIESRRGLQGQMKWRVLVQPEFLEAHFDQFKDVASTSVKMSPVESQNVASETDPYIGTRVRIKKVKKVKENIRKKEDSSKEECKKEPPKSADADIPPKGNPPIAQPAPSSSKPKRSAEEHALIRNLHWVSEQHRLLCLEEGREVKFHYHQLDPLQDYEASDGSLVWAKFCTGREKLYKANKARNAWDVDKAIAILSKLCNSFVLNGEEATLDKFRECADEGRQGFEVSWVRKSNQQKSNEVLDVKPGDPELERFMGLMYSSSAKPKTTSTANLKVINPIPKLKAANDR